MEDDTDTDSYLWPGEVAAIFNVRPETVARWRKAGHIARVGIRSRKTLGGWYLFHEGDVRRAAGQLRDGVRDG